jgi:ribosomal protein L30E
MEAIKKRKKNSLVELKKELGENKIVFGTKRTLKLLKKNNIEKIYLSATSPEGIMKLQELKKIKIEKLNMNSLELGKYLGKSFPVAVIGVMKNENIR